MKKIFICLSVLIFALNMISCSGDDGGSSDGPSVFYDATKEALPSFAEGESSKTVTWYWGSPIFEFYAMFADVNPGAYFNLYDALEKADDRFNSAVDNGTAITEQAIDAPWDVGFNSVDADSTYNKISTYYSTGYSSKTYARVDGDNYYMLHWEDIDNGSEESKSILQAAYDESTGDLKLGFLIANYVNKPGDGVVGWEIVRGYAEGNCDANLFSLKVFRDAPGYCHNVTGYGMARGVDEYFLLKLKNDSTDPPDTYYVFPADADASELQATMDDAGSTTVPAEDTEGYASELPSPFDATDTSTIPAVSEVESMTAPVHI